MTPAEMVGLGLILLLLIVGLTVAVVAVATVMAGSRGRQDTGVRVLTELRQLICDVLRSISLR